MQAHVSRRIPARFDASSLRTEEISPDDRKFLSPTMKSRLIRFLVLSALTAGSKLLAADPKVIDLWPEGVPDLKADGGEEKTDGQGRYWNIHHPTIEVYPAAKPNGTGVVLASGGGYQRVAIGLN